MFVREVTQVTPMGKCARTFFIGSWYMSSSSKVAIGFGVPDEADFPKAGAFLPLPPDGAAFLPLLAILLSTSNSTHCKHKAGCAQVRHRQRSGPVAGQASLGCIYQLPFIMGPTVMNALRLRLGCVGFGER